MQSWKSLLARRWHDQSRMTVALSHPLYTGEIWREYCLRCNECSWEGNFIIYGEWEMKYTRSLSTNKDQWEEKHKQSVQGKAQRLFLTTERILVQKTWKGRDKASKRGNHVSVAREWKRMESAKQARKEDVGSGKTITTIKTHAVFKSSGGVSKDIREKKVTRGTGMLLRQAREHQRANKAPEGYPLIDAETVVELKSFRIMGYPRSALR